MGVMETRWKVNGPQPIQRNSEGPLTMGVGRPIGERVWMTVMEGLLTGRGFPKVVVNQAAEQLTGGCGLEGPSREGGFGWGPVY